METNLTAEDVEARFVGSLREAKVHHLPAFLAYAQLRDLLSVKVDTAVSYRKAVESFLEALGDPLREADVRELPVDRWCQEFVKERRSTLSEQTLLTYQSRFRRAVDLYRLWLEDEAFPRSQPQDRGIGRFLGSSNPPLEFRPVEDVISAALQRTDEQGLVPYVCTLRDGRVTYLLLPLPLSRADAEQVSTYVRSLAVDPVEPDEPEEKFPKLDSTRSGRALIRDPESGRIQVERDQ